MENPFSTLNSGLRDETLGQTILSCVLSYLSVPSTRAYAMKRPTEGSGSGPAGAFSTLNSGLRDET